MAAHAFGPGADLIDALEMMRGAGRANGRLGVAAVEKGARTVRQGLLVLAALEAGRAFLDRILTAGRACGAQGGDRRGQERADHA